MTWPVASELVRTSLSAELGRLGGQSVRAADLIAVLQDAGMGVFAAGGAPRDWLSGKASSEVDLCVDHPLETVAATLQQAFPEMDATRFHLERFGMLRWGCEGFSQVDINILRSPDDIVDGDMWGTRFVARQDLAADARTRDFTINAFYYDFARQRILDPLGCGRQDLDARRLRFVADPRVLDGSYRMTFRIVQFWGRGYEPSGEVRRFLGAKADRDVLGMGEERLRRWVGTRLADGKLDLSDFAPRLRSHLRTNPARQLAARILEEF